jgi:CobQ-like glutamine amidotransferase family enzyme
MISLKITIGYLYPDIMSTCGDRGNIEAVVRRCGWRNIGCEVAELRMGDPVRPGEHDMFVIGGGGEPQQRLVAPDLYKVKGAGIRDAVSGGAAALAVGTGYELFGRFCQPEQGAELRGIELFDAWTIRLSGEPAAGAGAGADSAGPAGRASGELVVRWGSQLLTGFEDHSGGTYLGETAQPFGRVLAGQGNNGDGSEGVIKGAAVGTNLRGPCLPRNPVLADFLIEAAVSRRHGSPAELAPLADDLEGQARDATVARALPGRSGRAARAGARR